MALYSSATEPCAALSPYDCDRGTQKANIAAYPNRAMALDCAPPERQGLSTTVNELAMLAADTLSLAERIGNILDPQHGLSGQASEGKNPHVPHLCESLDQAANRLHSTNRILNRLIDFVGR